MVSFLTINGFRIKVLTDHTLSEDAKYTRLIGMFAKAEAEAIGSNDPYLLLFLSPLFPDEHAFTTRYSRNLPSNWRDIIYLILFPAFTEWYYKICRQDHLTLDEPSILGGNTPSVPTQDEVLM